MPKNLKIGLEPDSEVQIDVVRKQIYPAKSSQLEYFDADP